ncbi:MAG: gamma-glutamylcyclotransferase [Alphaproteobacteria bacterium]|nr:gamma-glutamylcyclotransferase [Alphaproteobacteria bacterium]
MIFAYGSLQRSAVQVAVVGRRLDGRPDSLPAHELSSTRIEDPQRAAALNRTHNANVTFNGRGDSLVPGMALDITEGELEVIDAYERLDGYARVALPLTSGARAWVYVAAGAAPRSPG